MFGVFCEWHKVLGRLLAKLAKADSGMAAMVRFTQEQLSERISQPQEKNVNKGDFLRKLLELHCATPEKVTTGDVFTTCITNIGAGSDTTSVSLSSLIYHLCRYPQSMQKLRDEIRIMETTGKISNPVSFAEAQQMPYLQPVMRMHPATGLPLGRVVPEGGKMLAGHALPAGVSCYHDSSAVH